MRTVGHTIQRGRQLDQGRIKVTLECSCGKVFAECLCQPGQESKAESLVYIEGESDAALHIATMDTLVKTAVAGQPCAA